jgi:putative FmdB family regulatory protein
MPVYDYDCANCGRRFEVIHGVHADPPAACPLCGGGPVRKAISAPAVHYRGSGWAKKERRTAAASGSSKSGDEGGRDGGSDGGDKADGGSKDGGSTPDGPSKAPVPAGESGAKTKTGGSDTGSSSKAS